MEVHVARIRHLIDCLQKSGASPEDIAGIMAQSGLTAADIDPPAEFCDVRNEAGFVRAACDMQKEITFGARAGLTFMHSSTLNAYISKYSRNLREAIEYSSRFHDIIDPAIAFSLRISGNVASFEADWKNAGYARYHRRTEFLMFAAVARIRAVTQTGFFPIEVRFQHQVGQAAPAFRKVAGFPVIFGAERMEILLSHSSLDLPIPTYDFTLRDHLVEYGNRLLAERCAPKQPLRARVEGLITASLPGRVIPAEEAAASLGMSPRTFTRRLREEGASYRAIVEDLRCDLAQTFIKTGMHLSEVSFALGYSDQAAFSTAFRRWTGESPSAFRERASFSDDA